MIKSLLPANRPYLSNIAFGSTPAPKSSLTRVGTVSQGTPFTRIDGDSEGVSYGGFDTGSVDPMGPPSSRSLSGYARGFARNAMDYDMSDLSGREISSDRRGNIELANNLATAGRVAGLVGLAFSPASVISTAANLGSQAARGRADAQLGELTGRLSAQYGHFATNNNMNLEQAHFSAPSWGWDNDDGPPDGTPAPVAAVTSAPISVNWGQVFSGGLLGGSGNDTAPSGPTTANNVQAPNSTSGFMNANTTSGYVEHGMAGPQSSVVDSNSGSVDWGGVFGIGHEAADGLDIGLGPGIDGIA